MHSFHELLTPHVELLNPVHLLGYLCLRVGLLLTEHVPFGVRYLNLNVSRVHSGGVLDGLRLSHKEIGLYLAGPYLGKLLNSRSKLLIEYLLAIEDLKAKPFPCFAFFDLGFNL